MSTRRVVSGESAGRAATAERRRRTAVPFVAAVSDGPPEAVAAEEGVAEGRAAEVVGLRSRPVQDDGAVAGGSSSSLGSIGRPLPRRVARQTVSRRGEMTESGRPDAGQPTPA